MSQLLGLPGHIKIVGGMRRSYRAGMVKCTFISVRRPPDAVLHRNEY